MNIKNKQGFPEWALDDNYLYFGTKKIALQQIVSIKKYLYQLHPEYNNFQSYDDFYTVTFQNGIMLPLFYEPEDEETVIYLIRTIMEKTGISSVPVVNNQEVYEQFRKVNYARFTNTQSAKEEPKSTPAPQKSQTVPEEIQNQRILIQQNKEIISLLKQMNENQEQMQTLSAIYERLGDLNHNLIVFYNTFTDVSDENIAASNRRYNQQQKQREQDLKRKEAEDLYEAFVGKKVHW